MTSFCSRAGTRASTANFLGCEYPLIQAPMAGVQGSALALAVCSAGALGSLPCALLGKAELRSELAALKAGARGPFNVNFFCHQAPAPDAQRAAAFRALLAPYYAELGLSESSLEQASPRAPFDAEAAAIVAEFQPAVVSFHFGLPAPELLARVRGCGAKVLSSATTLAEARWLQARGVDGVIAQGLEAGGHRGMFLSADLTTQIGTLALLPQLVRELSVPVIAAGGIADARGVAAARALGAAAVQVGTAYLLCPEATTRPVHRAALQSPQAEHTALTNLFTGRPARSVVNRLMRELGPIGACVPEFPSAAEAIAPLRAKGESLGRGDFSPLWSGQNAGGCRPIPAAELTRMLIAGL